MLWSFHREKKLECSLMFFQFCNDLMFLINKQKRVNASITTENAVVKISNKIFELAGEFTTFDFITSSVDDRTTFEKFQTIFNSK